jgi:hypothetical protein
LGGTEGRATADLSGDEIYPAGDGEELAVGIMEMDGDLRKASGKEE